MDDLTKFQVECEARLMAALTRVGVKLTEKALGGRRETFLSARIETRHRFRGRALTFASNPRILRIGTSYRTRSSPRPANWWAMPSPNKPLQPPHTAVTPRAGARVAPAGGRLNGGVRRSARPRR